MEEPSRNEHKFAHEDATVAIKHTQLADLATDDTSPRLDPDKNSTHYYYDYPSSYRWVMFVIFTIMSVFVGPTQVNLNPMVKLLHWGGAYSHLCTPEKEGYKILENGVIYCVEQDTAIRALYPYLISAMFAFDVVAGFILDTFGSKICTLVGITFEILGWMLLGLSGPYFNGYAAGLIFMALGSDPAFFGLLSVGYLFPGYTSVIMSIVGAARSVSFANGLVLQTVWNGSDACSLKGVSFTFAGVLAFWWLFAFFFMPFQSYPQLPAGSNLDCERGINKFSLKAALNKFPSVSLVGLGSKCKSEWQDFKQHALTFSYALLVMLPTISLIRGSYYGSASDARLPHAKNFLDIMNVLSMIPCPILGLLADKVSATLVVSFLGLCGSLSIVCIMIPLRSLEYISVVFHWFCISFMASQFYVVCAYCYPQRQMGKLLGFIFLVAALFSLIARPMYEYSVTVNPVPMDTIIVILCIISTIVAVFLWLILEKPMRSAAVQLATMEE